MCLRPIRAPEQTTNPIFLARQYTSTSTSSTCALAAVHFFDVTGTVLFELWPVCKLGLLT